MRITGRRRHSNALGSNGPTCSLVPMARARLRASGAVAAAAALFVASGASTHAEELIVRTGETHVLRAGNHRYDLVRLGLSATIELTGTTLVIAEKLVTDGDANLRYRGSDTEHVAKYFDFVILDGREMQGTLSIDGNGKSRPEADRGHDREAQGGNGKPGAPGEAGMDIDLSLFEINPAAHVKLVSRGGRGGKGGDGGTGAVHLGPVTCIHYSPGAGGGVLDCGRARHGGRGGDGANGGNGGNAGRIRVFGVPQESASASALDELQRYLSNNVSTDVLAGQGGDGGAGGPGLDWVAHYKGQDGRAGVAGSAGGIAAEPVKMLIGTKDWLAKGKPR